MKIQNNIRHYRKAKGIKLTELSRLMKVDHAAVVGWEKQKYQPREKLHKRLAEILKVTEEQLFYLQAQK